MAFLIAGLGNPGPQYAATRHNVGFWFIDALASHFDIALADDRRFAGELGSVTINEQKCWLFKPGRFMNRSGGPVAALARYYRIPVKQTLLVVDDIDLPAGRMRLRETGGHGGHNGMRDVINALGSGEFPRLRFGVGHPGDAEAVVDHVLGRPAAADKAAMMTAIERAVPKIEALVGGEFARVQTEINSA